VEIPQTVVMGVYEVCKQKLAHPNRALSHGVVEPTTIENVDQMQDKSHVPEKPKPRITSACVCGRGLDGNFLACFVAGVGGYVLADVEIGG